MIPIQVQEPNSEGRTKLSHASQLKQLCDSAVGDYVDRRGVGVDHYHGVEIWHAMAEAKFLRFLALAARHQLRTPNFCRLHGSRAVKRLGSRAYVQPGGEIYWGLGFSYKDAPIEEPYLVTSSIVCSALLDALDAGLEIDGLSDLTERAVDSLARWPWRMASAAGEIPRFSPATKGVIVNAVTIWNTALTRATAVGLLRMPHDGSRWPEFLKQSYRPGFGWTYTPESDRIDLLHQCYIIHHVMDVDGYSGWSDRFVDVLSSFVTPGGFVDHYDLRTREVAMEAGATSGKWRFRTIGDFAQVYYDAPPRPWSIGEKLTVCGRLGEGSAGRDFWRAMVRAVIAGRSEVEPDLADWVVRVSATHGVRHTMHLALGAAWGLVALRTEATRRADGAK